RCSKTVSTSSNFRGPNRLRRLGRVVPSSGGPFTLPMVRTMSDASTSSAASECRYGFPKALDAWLARNGDLLDSLLALRRLGAEGAEEVSAILCVRRVVEVRASWQLWEALTEGDGNDPDAF